MPKPTHRTMWMFPRNIRRIEAWKMVQIATLLDACSANTTSQITQDQLYAQLAKLGIKVKANQYGVANAGGMRTYFAQLACLGLFWKDSDKQFQTTFSGECLINAEEPVRILRCQLLRMQYPSVYGLGQNVRISPALKVRPFVFLINLLRDARLDGYLTCMDMAVPVVYGRTHKDHDKCVEKILALRKSQVLRDVIDSVDDLRTPKRYTENDPEADWSTGLEDAKNIANTAKNYMEAVQLLVADPDDSKKFILNEESEVLEDITTWGATTIEPLDPSRPESWQMRFGRYTKTKSVRSPSQSKRNGIQALVRSNFVASVSATPYDLDVERFIANEAKRWGLPEAEIGLHISDIVDRKPNIERDVVRQAAASGGKEAILLEKAVTAIFKKLGFDLSEHIGQRVPPVNRDGGYPDIRVRTSNTDDCGFADTKASMNYNIPLGDSIKLQTYYKDCWNEFPDQTPSSYFIYIAGGFGRKVKTVENELKQCSKRYNAPVCAITVNALLDLMDNPNPPDVETLTNAFKKEGVLYTTAASLLQA